MPDIRNQFIEDTLDELTVLCLYLFNNSIVLDPEIRARYNRRAATLCLCLDLVEAPKELYEHLTFN